MITPTAFDSDRAALYRERGWWGDRTVDDVLAATVAEHGDSVAVIDGEAQLTYRDLDARVEALAGALQAEGVKRGEAVAWQLPNWWEGVVLHAAIGRAGAVSCPLHLIYRQSELRLVLGEARPRLFFTCDGDGRLTRLQQAREACAVLADAPRVIPVRGAEDGFGELLDRGLRAEPSGCEADDVTLLLYTSGTTAMPKGVLHTHNSLLRGAYEMGSEFGELESDDRLFVPSPLTHATGILYGYQVPAMVGAGAVLMDVWDVGKGLDLIRDHGCTFMGGATPFFRALIDEVDARGLGPDDLPAMRGTCGGADVNPALIGEAEERLGCMLARAYGMSEYPIVSASPWNGDLRPRSTTEGRALRATELWALAEDGSEASPGTPGQAVFRGPCTFAGYLDAARNPEGLDPEGRILSGDLITLDGDGNLTVTGRIKDIIIRGGENIAVKEVEDLLLEHPAVHAVAIVGMPDPLLAERACACVQAEAGKSVDLPELVAFLRLAEIAPQKFPERLELMPEGLPTTASGKVQKHRLREIVAARSIAETDEQRRQETHS